jgi:hypothetical protein
MYTQIKVRAVCEEDLDTLACIEKEVWSRLNTPILSRENLQEWYEDNSPFFLVALQNGEICGYYFGKIISFDITAIDKFLEPTRMTGLGFTTHLHDPQGSFLYGINIVSLVRGTGRILYETAHKLCAQLQIPYSIGITRLPGLALYMEEIESILGPILPDLHDEIATSYICESAKLLGMPIEKIQKSELFFPQLSVPDHMLAFHVQGTISRLMRLVSNYIVPDPESLNYGACFVSEFLHR